MHDKDQHLEMLPLRGISNGAKQTRIELSTSRLSVYERKWQKNSVFGNKKLYEKLNYVKVHEYFNAILTP